MRDEGLPHYKRNYERNGIEIYFDSKPSVVVRDLLKNNGWRWSSFGRCWYNYYSEFNVRFAESICDKKMAGVFNSELVKQTTPTLESKKPRKKGNDVSERKEQIETSRIKGQKAGSLVEVIRVPYSNGDHCIITFEDQEKKVGIIDEVDA